MVKILAGSDIKTIYVAGPMSGLHNFNYDTFNVVAGVLRSAGYTVLNPAEFQGGYQDKSWHDYMRYDIQIIIDEADAVVLLPDWEGSKGANVEVTVARAIGLPVWDCSDLGIAVKNNPPENKFAVDHPDAPASGYINGAYVYDEATMGAAAQQLIVDSETGAAYMGVVVEDEIEETILEEAQRLVHGDRQDDYGHPLDDFTKTGLIWTACLIDKLKPDAVVDAEDVALMMVGVKISRQVNRPKRDNLVDGSGYFATLDMVIKERERRSTVLVG
jgi:hypothetical protein